jgi:hypothetical protein
LDVFTAIYYRLFLLFFRFAGKPGSVGRCECGRLFDANGRNNLTHQATNQTVAMIVSMFKPKLDRPFGQHSQPPPPLHRTPLQSQYVPHQPPTLQQQQSNFATGSSIPSLPPPVQQPNHDFDPYSQPQVKPFESQFQPHPAMSRVQLHRINQFQQLPKQPNDTTGADANHTKQYRYVANSSSWPHENVNAITNLLTRLRNGELRKEVRIALNGSAVVEVGIGRIVLLEQNCLCSSRCYCHYYPGWRL